ncbi:hypothetical protein EYF80_030504 [Liparis tanakae]|uniref:Uncharacterized protein n=1 Tax=Liparis tanakae TaxID=230148 RepID=A0A4Z2H0P2_9TELE|nr:hypothetical protein EYF80_030504 [Liparis tanakae]
MKTSYRLDLSEGVNQISPSFQSASQGYFGYNGAIDSEATAVPAAEDRHSNKHQASLSIVTALQDLIAFSKMSSQRALLVFHLSESWLTCPSAVVPKDVIEDTAPSPSSDETSLPSTQRDKWQMSSDATGQTGRVPLHKPTWPNRKHQNPQTIGDGLLPSV